MSKDRELNSGWLGSTEGSPQHASSGNSPSDVEKILQGCALESLQFNRDDLFFQAGIAAGRRSGGLRFFWPSAAAALLLVSIGLGVALHNQSRSIVGLETALAAVQQFPDATAGSPSSVPGLATLGGSTAEQASSGTQDDFEARPFADDRLRHWQRLASPAPLPPGRLTAMGWTEIGNGDWGMGNAASREPSEPTDHKQQSSPVHRPATYFELRQSYSEG